MNITGHNSFSGCRFCNIRGNYSYKYHHVYFHPDPNNKYIKKKHSDWLSHINEIESTVNSSEKAALIKQYGKSYYLYY